MGFMKALKRKFGMGGVSEAEAASKMTPYERAVMESDAKKKAAKAAKPEKKGLTWSATDNIAKKKKMLSGLDD